MTVSGCCPRGIPHWGHTQFSGRRAPARHPRAHSPAAHTLPARPEVEAREPHNVWVRLSFPQHLSLKWSGGRRGIMWQ